MNNNPHSLAGAGPRVRRSLKLRAALGYLRLYWFIKRKTGLNTRGLGFVLRTINHEFAFDVHGKSFVFSPACASAYCLLPAGIWNEPETHLFFDRLITNGRDRFTFIDVGASIGEMVMDIAARPQTVSVLAFEPQPSCATAISRSAQLNGFGNVEVRQLAVSDYKGVAAFETNTYSPTASRLSNSPIGHINGDGSCKVSTLDEECRLLSGQVLMLVDVEGSEPKVLAGGTNLIQRTRPCIIFEYNNTSKQYFSLDQVQNVLGKAYKIYRLRSDGLLDRDFEHSWNCVAIHDESVWALRCDSLLGGERQGH